MAGVRYDLRGRLLSFYAVPPQRETEATPAAAAQAASPAPAAAPAAPLWSVLFVEAKLDPAAFKPVAPQWTPPFFSDSRAAWEGAWPSRPDLPLRIEAASYRGRPVWFQVVEPVDSRRARPGRTCRPRGSACRWPCCWASSACCWSAGPSSPSATCGSAAATGAGRSASASAMFSLGMASWLLVAHHVADPVAQLIGSIRGAGLALVLATVLWLFYLALEPYVRRERPWTIVSWSRLLDGGLRDAVVWRDVLYGAAWGVLLTLAGDFLSHLPALLGRPEPAPFAGHLEMLLGVRPRLALAIGLPSDAALLSLGMLLLFLVFRLVLRRDLPAGIALVLLFAALSVAQSEQPLWLSLPTSLVVSALLVGVLLRFGLVATMAGIWVSDVLSMTPHSLELESWQGGGTAFVVPLVIVLGFYAFRRATWKSPGHHSYAAAETSSSHSG